MAFLLRVYAFLTVGFHSVFAGSFQISPSNVTGLNGASLTLSCHANSVPADIQWTLDDSVVRSTSSITTTYSAGDGTIEFSPLSYMNEGVYRCVAVNDTGQELFRSHPGRVDVLGQPSILIPPSSVSVVTGSAAEFTCTVISDPPGVVTWHFNHQQLQSNSKYTVQSDRLIISNVQESDEGYYDCNVTNSFGSAFVSARLSIATVQGTSPTVTLMPGDTVAAEVGTSQSIGCYTTGTPTPAVYWTRNGSVVMETNQLSITRQPGNSTLSFRTLSTTDGGSYECFANNTHGTDFVSVLLLVLVGPVVTRVPDDVIVRAGEAPTEPLQCEATGNLPPIVNILDPLGRIISTTGVWNPNSLSRQDGGTYTCAATNSVGTSTSTFTVTVHDVPVFTTRPQNASVSIGDEVTLQCVAEGPPEPVLTWMGPNRTIISDGDTTGGNLRIYDVAQSDAGEYMCTATNDIGSMTASATITVNVLPTISVLPREVFVSIGGNFTLECVATPLPSNPSYKWYFNNSVLSGKTQSTVTVDNAQVEHSGKYHCELLMLEMLVATATVTVGTTPSITISPTPEVLLLPGNRATLHCTGIGTPIPRLSWDFIDEMEQRTTLSDTGNIRVYSNNSLLLLNVDKFSSGRYLCVLDNGVGRMEATSVLRVEGSPVVTTITPPALVLGLPGTVTCQVIYNYPTANITWSFPGQTPTFSGNMLVLDAVESVDGGQYTCTARNQYGTSSLTNTIVIYVRPTATVVNDTANAYIDGRVELICSGEGVPEPNITWTSPSGEKTSSPTLQLSSVQLSDSGTYSCTASNVVGSNSADVQLSVRGAPPTQINVVPLTKTSVTISWSAPVFSGQLITYMYQFGATRDPVDSYEVDEDNVRPMVTKTNLDEGTEYVFMVRGVFTGNHLGELVSITFKTEEDVPTAAPQNISVTAEYYGELTVRWNPPPVTDRNGVITIYNIFYRITPESAPEDQLFTLIPALPGGQHIIRNLQENVSYDIMMQAVTSVGGGPNSTLVTAVTTRLPLELILGVTIGGGSLLIIAIVTFFICCGCCIWRKKHKGALDVENEKSSKNKKKRGISGPIADEPPFIDPYNPGKFGVVNQSGDLIALQPKIITSYDIAPPPMAGETAQRVRQVKLKQSAPLDLYSEPHDSLQRESDRPPSKEVQVVSEAFDYMNEWDSTGDITGYTEGPDVSIEDTTADDFIQPLDVILGKSSSDTNKEKDNSFVGSQDKEPLYARIPEEHISKKKTAKNQKSKNKVMQKAMTQYQQRLGEYQPQFDEMTSPLALNEYHGQTNAFDFGMADLVEAETKIGARQQNYNDTSVFMY